MEGDVSLGSMERIMDNEGPPKKKIKWVVIIPIIAILVVVAVVLSIIVSLSSGSEDEDTCIKGEKEKCKTCDGDKCGSCNDGYILVDGQCKKDFSFISTYNVESTEESIKLFDVDYLDNVIFMSIDNEQVDPVWNCTFNETGEHTVSVKLNTANIDSLYLFEQALNLTSVYFSKEFNTENITSMSSFFNGCSNLVSVDISNFNFEKVENASEMFSNCTSLNSISFSNSKTNSLTDIGYMFFDIQSFNAKS